MIMGITDIPPNETKALHEHSSPEVAYVLEGEVIVSIKDKTPFVVRKGKSFQISAGIMHMTKSEPNGAKVVFTIVK